MTKDGLKERDKQSIASLLPEVSDWKNNSHELRRSMWNEVSEDWPFYSEKDRVIVRRRKPQNLTPPGSDTGSTSSGHSPSSTKAPSPPQITNPLKRTSFKGETQMEDAPAPKKMRMSHYMRLGAPSVYKVEDDCAPNWDKWGREQAESPELPGRSQMQKLVPIPNRNMDFLEAYTTIVTKEQRINYKVEFDQDYTKYRMQHKLLDKVSKRFSRLDFKLRQHQRGSEGFKDVMSQIYEEYERKKRDEGYQDARYNFQYLHEKLAHIKKLVRDYNTEIIRLRSSG